MNSSSELTKNSLDEEFNNVKIDVINDDEIKKTQLNSINVTASVRNVSINEDIPSFREWTKKQLEEAEKQPSIITYNLCRLIFLFFIFFTPYDINYYYYFI